MLHLPFHHLSTPSPSRPIPHSCFFTPTFSSSQLASFLLSRLSPRLPLSGAPNHLLPHHAMRHAYALRSPSGAGIRRTNLLANHLCCTRKTQQKGPVKVQPLRHEAQRMNMKFKFLSKREESIHWFRPLMLINPKISCKFSK